MLSKLFEVKNQFNKKHPDTPMKTSGFQSYQFDTSLKPLDRLSSVSGLLEVIPK